MNRKLPSETPIETRTSDQSAEQMRSNFGVAGHFMTSSDLNNKVLCHVEESVANVFAFARKLLEVRDPQTLFLLQTEFIQAQLEAMAMQIQDISKVTTTTMLGTGRPTETGPSS